MTALQSALAPLTEAQLAQVLQHLFTHFDESPVPAITPEEVEAQLDADRAYLTKLSAQVHPRPSEPDVRALIVALTEAVPETLPVTQAAIERATSATTLPIDPDTAMSVLVIAASAAILRPKVTFRRTTKQNETDLNIGLDVRGTKSLDSVLELITQFLNRQP